MGMLFSSSLLLINCTAIAQAIGAGGRSACGVFPQFDSKASAYKARSTAIAGLPAVWVTPQIAVLRLHVLIVCYAAARIEAPRDSKYTSSGVRYPRD